MAHAPSKLEVSEWTVRVLGGGWLQTHRGKAFDAFRAAPSVGSEAEAWAESAGFGRSARFATDLYGVYEAKLLCEVYANKCQFYYDRYKERLKEGRDEIADEAEYVEPPEFEELLSRLNGRQLKRAQWVRDLKP